MRYYTKEWYKAVQNQDYLVDVEMIEDREYKENDIRKFYEEALQKAIDKAEKEHNTPPFFPISPEDIQDEDFELGNWVMFGEGACNMVPVTSAMKLRKQLEMQQHKMLEEFNQRPEFDPQEKVAKEFAQQYQERLKNIHDQYPDWVVERVDERLLALQLLPQNIFQKLQKIVKESQELVETVEDLVEQENRKQKEKIPNDIWYIIYGELADSILLKIEEEDKCLCITIQRITQNYPDDEPIYKKIVFYNCNILHMEEGIMTDDTGKIGACNLELYKQPKGYQLDFLIFAKELQYMTIAFEDAESETIELNFE